MVRTCYEVECMYGMCAVYCVGYNTLEEFLLFS